MHYLPLRQIASSKSLRAPNPMSVILQFVQPHAMKNSVHFYLRVAPFIDCLTLKLRWVDQGSNENNILFLFIECTN